MRYHLKTLEEVNESLRGEYVADPKGGFKLKVDDLDINDLSNKAQRAASLETQFNDTDGVIKSLKDRLSTTEEAQKKAEARYYEQTVAQKATEAFLKAGGNEKALGFVLTQVKSTFKFNDKGELVAEADGKPVVNKDGKAHSIDSYIKDVIQPEHNYLFKPSSGGGAGGSATPPSGGAFTGPNPFKKETYNATAQAQLYKSDKATAIALATEAGYNLK